MIIIRTLQQSKLIHMLTKSQYLNSDHMHTVTTLAAVLRIMLVAKAKPREPSAINAVQLCSLTFSKYSSISWQQHINSGSSAGLTDGRRLSRPRHCSRGVQPVSKAVYHSDVYDKPATAHGGPLTPQSGMLPPDHCDLQETNRNVYNKYRMKRQCVKQCQENIHSRQWSTIKQN